MSQFAFDVSTEDYKDKVIEASLRVPVVIGFWAPWAGPSQALKPILEKLAEEFAGRFLLAKVDADENPGLAQELAVRSIPTIKVLYDGQLVDEFIGALPEGQIRAFLDRNALPVTGGKLRKEVAAAVPTVSIDEAPMPPPLVNKADITTNAIGSKSSNWIGKDLVDLSRQLQERLILRLLEEVSRLGVNQINELGFGREKFNSFAYDLEKLESVKDISLDLEKKINLFLQIADSWRQLMTESQLNELGEVVEGFRRWMQLTNILPDLRFMEMLRRIPVFLGIGLIVGLIVEWTLGHNLGVFVWVGLTLLPPAKFAMQKSSQMKISMEIDSVRAKLQATMIRLIDKAERENSSRMDSIMANLRREQTEVVGELDLSARGILADYRQALSVQLDRAGYRALDWGAEVWSEWKPAVGSPGLVRIGTVTTRHLTEKLSQLFPDLDFLVETPAATKFPMGAPLLFQADSRCRPQAIGSLQAMTARLLATIPPGKVRFTFIDPIGLGQNVAGFMPLGDYVESLVTSRAWSEPEHIEKRLKELTEHIENVVQKYLRQDFQSIEDYNRQAQEVAEPYRVLVVFDFPVNFTEASARRLVSLVQNGPRCGVYPIILQDTSKPLPYGFSLEDLLQGTSRVHFADGRFRWSEHETAGWAVLQDEFRVVEESPNKKVLRSHLQDGRYQLSFDLEPAYEKYLLSGLSPFLLDLDPPCPPILLNRIIQGVGEAAKENMTVVVPYAKVLSMAGLDPEHPTRWWQAGRATAGNEESSAASVEVPLGPSGARKAQLLTLGKGTAHHALIAGRTGSGKSNLLHVIITTLAVKYSPQEIELYLIDFKKGVEFKSYANHALPHARVIAIESEREFGLSVLQGLDAQMQRRGETFRAVAANSIAEYRAKTKVRLPRIILIIDEFQEFFSEDDATARQAASIIDRLVRQGRSFGIHLLLGSQSLAGSTLARSTLDQMQIRIALPCSEADSRLILADDNPAARLLARPGEAIYNAASGLVEGNQIFQVALFSDEDREHYLQAIAARAGAERRPPLVFEGHEPADIGACEPLSQLLAAPDWQPAGKATEVWIGEPVAMTAPTSVRFRRQGGANLAIVTREEEEGVGLLSACVLGLAAQHRPDAAKLYIVDLATADAPWSELSGELADLLPHRIEVLGRRDIPALLTDLSAEIQRRIDDERSARAWSGYLIIQGVHRARDLRSDPAQGYQFGEEEANASPAEQFATILREGPEVGIHTLVWCDTYLNLDRALDARALREFGHRVAGTMTQEDSMRLIDDAAASRLDRPHRMVKYDEDQTGVLEKFRPYRIPTTAWLERMAEMLRGRLQ